MRDVPAVQSEKDFEEKASSSKQSKPPNDSMERELRSSLMKLNYVDLEQKYKSIEDDFHKSYPKLKGRKPTTKDAKINRIITMMMKKK